MTVLDIEKLEDRLRRAMLGGDIAELDRLISDRLMFVTPDGAIVDKAADLGAHRSGVIRISTLVPVNRRIELFGTTAIVNVEVQLAGTFAGAAFAGRYRYTRVWWQEGDQVLIVAGSACVIQ